MIIIAMCLALSVLSSVCGIVGTLIYQRAQAALKQPASVVVNEYTCPAPVCSADQSNTLTGWHPDNGKTHLTKTHRIAFSNPCVTQVLEVYLDGVKTKKEMVNLN